MNDLFLFCDKELSELRSSKGPPVTLEETQGHSVGERGFQMTPVLRLPTTVRGVPFDYGGRRSHPDYR